MKNILTFGEAMALFIADDVGSLENISNFTRYSAGAEMNVAIGLSRLNFNVYYGTQLGNDPFGLYIKNCLEKEKIKTDYVFNTDIANTGFMVKEKVEKGDPLVVSYRKNSACSKFDLEKIKDIDLTNIDLAHFTGIFLGVSNNTLEISKFLCKKAREAGSIVTFDPNLRPGLWEDEKTMIETTNQFAFNCDFVLPGISEGKILMGSDDPDEIADFYIKGGVKHVIIKLGEKGGYYKSFDGKSAYIDGFKVDTVIDTVGAGDGFATGVISGILDEVSLEETVKRGTAIGALQVMSPSDNADLPNRDELFNYMNMN